jgi:AbiV family abortive infection protein
MALTPMSKKHGWNKEVTPARKLQLEKSARASFANGCSLHDDALALYSLGRFPRAAALAVLAEEEFSKAFLLSTCAEERRWDSNIYKALREHNKKQGFAEALRDHVDWYTQAYLDSIIAGEPPESQELMATNPPAEINSSRREKVESRWKKPIKDFLKQDAFYVSINEEGAVKSLPETIEETKAKQCLDESQKLRMAIDILLNGRSSVNVQAP